MSKGVRRRRASEERRDGEGTGRKSISSSGKLGGKNSGGGGREALLICGGPTMAMMGSLRVARRESRTSACLFLWRLDFFSFFFCFFELLFTRPPPSELRLKTCGT